MKKKIIIGTRGSKLALIYAQNAKKEIIKKTDFKDLLIIEKNIFKDLRGHFHRDYCDKDLSKINFKVKVDLYSQSAKSFSQES